MKKRDSAYGMFLAKHNYWIQWLSAAKIKHNTKNQYTDNCKNRLWKTFGKTMPVCQNYNQNRDLAYLFFNYK